MLKPKLQYFGYLMQTADSLEKSLMLGKTESSRRGHQRMRCLDGITDAMDINLGKLWEMVRDREAWCAAVHGVEKSLTPLGNWTTITSCTLDFPGGSASKESACNVGDLGSIPGSGRSPGEGNGNTFLDSCLENSMDVEEPGGLQSMGLQRVSQD